MMSSFEPFFFGKDHDLFGIYHPSSGPKKDHSVVVAPPLLNEYMRSHLALRQISSRLAQSGIDVLRFDYAGTGNSLGHINGVSVDQWSSNVFEAASEVREITGNTRTSILAVRFAANLAADYARIHPTQQFVMWDPVFGGEAWLNSLLRSQAKLLRQHGSSVIDQSCEFSGQKLSGSFVDELRSRPTSTIHSSKSFAVVTDSFDQTDFLIASKIEHKRINFHCGWEDLTSQVLYAHEVVDSVCQAVI